MVRRRRYAGEAAMSREDERPEIPGDAIPASHDGRCVCRDPIRAGDPIVRDGERWVHEECRGLVPLPRKRPRRTRRGITRQARL